MKSVSGFFLRWPLILILWLAFIPYADAENIVPQDNILVYFGVEDSAIFDNPLSVSIDQFKSHLNLIRSYKWSAVKISDLADRKITDHSIALTFDNPSRTTMENIFPLLEAIKLPVTLLFTTDNLDQQKIDALSWDDLRALKKREWIEIGLIGKNYNSFIGMNDENRARNLNASIARFEEKLGMRPSVFAPPFGDYDNALLAMLKERKINIVLGMQSGSLGGDRDRPWPRFSMTDRYGDDERFKVAATAQLLNVADILPAGSLADNPPSVGFTLNDKAVKPEQLNCFSNADQKISKTILENRIELRFPAKISPSRIRVNCTAALKDEDGNQYLKWWGTNLLVR